MVNLRLMRFVLPICCALSLTGCEGPLESDTLRGTYVLSQIGAAGPPLLIVDHTFSNGERQTTRIVFDSLTFTSDTTIQRNREIETIYRRSDGSQIGPLKGGDGYPGRYARNGDRLIVRWRSSLNPSVNRTDTLRIQGNNLVRDDYTGLVCSEGCPAPKRLPFVYRRR